MSSDELVEIMDTYIYDNDGWRDLNMTDVPEVFDNLAWYFHCDEWYQYKKIELIAYKRCMRRLERSGGHLGSAEHALGVLYDALKEDTQEWSLSSSEIEMEEDDEEAPTGIILCVVQHGGLFSRLCRSRCT